MTSASTYSEAERTAEQSTAAQAQAVTSSEVDSALAALPLHQPPDLSEACLLHGQPGQPDEVNVIVSQLALKQIAVHSHSMLDQEVGGALLGYAYRNDGQAYVEVRAAIPAVTNDQGPVHFTFTADAWSRLHQDRSELFPELDIVGWFHTHPDLGVFYSGDDAIVHSAAFTLPWHVGMVVDPIRRETCFFGWKSGALAAYTGFYESLDLQPYSLLEWQVVRTTVWDQSYEYQDDREPGESMVYLPPNSSLSLRTLGPYIALGIGAASFLLSIFLLLGWVLPLNQEVDRLQNMVIVLADKALADGNAATCPNPRLRILGPSTGQSLPVGSAIEVMGTTLIEDAVRYEVNVRPAGTGEWVLIESIRGDTKFGQLALWNTAEVLPGVFEIRLTAVDSNNIRLPNSPPCAIALELTP